MVCAECAEAALENRKEWDEIGEIRHSPTHPEKCGCTCMHRVGPWEKMFSVERPNA